MPSAEVLCRAEGGIETSLASNFVVGTNGTREKSSKIYLVAEPMSELFIQAHVGIMHL
jgi:hypothetical protein